MKIAVIKRKFMESGGGGAEVYAQNACAGLTAKGHDLTIISEEFPDNKNGLYKYIKIPKSANISSSGTISFNKRVQKYINTENLRDKFDIIYALSRTYPATIFRAAEQIHAEWMRLNKSNIQQLNPRHSGILKLEKNIYSTSNTKSIVTNSKLVKNLINQIYHYPEENIHILLNGVDKSKFYPALNVNEKNNLRKKLFNIVDQDKTVLLFAGANFEIKGLKHAIKAISKLSKEILDKVVLYVAGGDSSETYVEYSKKRNISEKIKFLGSKSNMRDYYVAADLFLFPSIGEPFGNVCLEACTCGLPVLNTKQNGSCELIKENRNGYIVDSAKNTKAMTSFIAEHIMLSENEKNEFSKAAIEATKNYSWEKHISCLENLFNKLK
ncbi:MAG: glycosyltransferase family 4 protein [bacterium]|nr:glycosyltransferase family 4 protein [bacterium]